MTGVTHLQGHFLGLDEPVAPLLPNSDYQTGIVRLASADKINSGNYRANEYSILSILAYVTGEYGDQAVRQEWLKLMLRTNAKADAFLSHARRQRHTL